MLMRLNYLKKKDDIRRLDGSINHLETFVNNDVEKMVRYLKENKYIDEETSDILPRGIIASEISECNEILLTEIILADFFLDLSQEEIVATLAAFIEEKTNEEVTFDTLDVPDSVKQVLSNINYIGKPLTKNDETYRLIIENLIKAHIDQGYPDNLNNLNDLKFIITVKKNSKSSISFIISSNKLKVSGGATFEGYKYIIDKVKKEVIARGGGMKYIIKIPETLWN